MEEYRRLKKLQSNTSLAQDVRYCYSPEYQVENDIGRNDEITDGPLKTDI